ncbi:hypothetical protein [Desulfopila sp. IMCC35008]|uniref:hypothetical protein n=1 Tax=Desulfopila sp. IMCC35008 TaxID=2653858 RepID=UPI0013D6EA70|nr:hypothetical protein [Desulfopila sp. IMCC35008]
MKRKLAILLIALLVTPVAAQARRTTLSGGISAGYDYTERIYDLNDTNEGDSSSDSTSRDDDETSRLVISPTITIISESERDSVSFDYTPSFLYDLDESDNDLDHHLTLDYNRSLSRNWSIKLSDSFVDTDEFNSYGTPDGLFDEEADDTVVSATPTTENRLRDESGRRRYYTNTFFASTDYTYFEESVLSFGYSWNILRNDDVSEEENYEDYDKHDLNFSVSHRFNSQWKMSGYGRYIQGIYDSPEDTTVQEDVETATGNDDLYEYHAGLSLSSEFKQHHPVTLSYDFSETEYDSENTDNSQIHAFNIGYQWAATPRLDASFGIGPTYSKQNDSEDSWDTNGYLTILYRLERGSFSFNSTAGTEFENFSGTDERGFSQYWQTRADYNYTLIKDLTLGLYCYYRNENRGELAGTPVGEVDELTTTEIEVQQYALGGSLSYTFYENYTAAFSYGFVNQSSDLPDDEYDDHRVQLTVSYQNDFMQW